MEASAYDLDSSRFNKFFELPADPTRDRPTPFKVKYADYGYRNEAHPEEENVFLFFGPLMGSRLLHIAKDEIAKKRKIRMINLDRPGIGGTDPVDAKHRMAIWLDVVPALLQHLGIQHVSIGCHSGGTIYALDFLLHHPEILHPERPYLAIGGPWILPTHTGSTALSILQSLPSSLIRNTDTLAKLINNYIGPTIGVSIGVVQTLVTKFMPASSSEGDTSLDRAYARIEQQLWPRVIDRVYAEGIHGISSDAILFLKKVDGMSGWSNWGDYDALVPRLAEALRASGRRLQVQVFYAENDALIGNEGSKGSVWFDQCWGVQHRGDMIDYSSTTIQGADHDSIWELRWGAVQKVLEQVGQPMSD